MTRLSAAQDNETNWEREFEELFKASYPRVLAYLIKLSGEEEAAMDICQDIYAGLWEKKFELPVPAEEKLYYLFSVARNAFYQFTRKSLREQKDLQDLVSHAGVVEVPASRLELSEQQELLESALEEAPEVKKRYYLLNREHGMTYKQIAHQEGVSEKTVERYISHVLKSLRTRLTSFFLW